MSIVSLSDGSGSDFKIDDLKEIAAQLNIDLKDSRDAADYLRLLWSFESVMKTIDDGPDYIHPALIPQPVSTNRDFWVPSSEDNPFNAWSHRCHLEAAKPINNTLQGRTVAIKDNISVGGLPTTLGAPPSLLSESGSYQPSPIDATVVSRLLASGAVIKGTATCECFCASPLSFTSATGPVHNPRLRGYTSGGSSSGSSVLVTAHTLTSQAQGGAWGETAELAIGSDQGGSVRIPAAYNGIYGLKPTFGLVPYTGAASMSPMMDHLGPLASRLEDIAALLEVMAGYDGIDPRMTPESPLLGQVKPYQQILAAFRDQISAQPDVGRSWKIGLIKESFLVPGISPVVRDTVAQVVKTFYEAVGATVVEVSIPLHLAGPAIWTASTRPSMSNFLCQGKVSGHLSYLSPHLQPRWPPTQDTYDIMTSLNPALANIVFSERFAERCLKPGIEAKAHRKVFELRDAYDTALKEVDVLITPCAPTIAMPHPEDLNSDGQPLSVLERLQVAVGVISNTSPFNVTGHPGLSVPCGFSSPPARPDVQLPIGMQVVGQRWSDEKVIMAAALFERGRELTASK